MGVLKFFFLHPRKPYPGGPPPLEEGDATPFSHPILGFFLDFFGGLWALGGPFFFVARGTDKD